MKLSLLNSTIWSWLCS